VAEQLSIAPGAIPKGKAAQQLLGVSESARAI
jgi:hypothetical protein